jgi:hypothetical protein
MICTEEDEPFDYRLQDGVWELESVPVYTEAEEALKRHAYEIGESASEHIYAVGIQMVSRELLENERFGVAGKEQNGNSEVLSITHVCGGARREKEGEGREIRNRTRLTREIQKRRP